MVVRDETGTRGSILVFTLWILVCLTLISLGFGHRVRLETKAAGYTVANTQAFYKAESALYEKAIELIGGRGTDGAEAAQNNGVEDGGDEWDVRCEAVPEEGKVNVNLAPEDMIRNLKPIKGGIGRAILRKRLGDDLKRGGDDDVTFRLPEELLIVEEIDPEEWYGEKEGEPGIRDLFTVYGDGKIDLNSALPEIIEAIPGIDRRVAADIVAFRTGPDGTFGTKDDHTWKSFKEFKASLKLSEDKLAPITKYCKIGSDFYTITVAASKSGSRATARIAAVIRIGGDDFSVVSWRET